MRIFQRRRRPSLRASAPSALPSASRALVAALASAALVSSCQRASVTRGAAPAGGAAADSLAVRRDIAYLASDALEGRGTGTPGNDSAAAYIARRYAALRLVPIAPADLPACAQAMAAGRKPPTREGADDPCRMEYLQRFSARPNFGPHTDAGAGLPTQNVVALLPGSDPALGKEYIVIGAHFDHLGRSASFAVDRNAGDAIRNGADDNASGTAAVMELARLLARRPPRRSVIFANFSGEELGVLGSQHFVENPLVPVARMVAMLNFDMVGRMRGDSLIVYGTATATEMPRILDSANVAPRLTLRPVGDGFGPSDHSSFYAKNIPVLHFFTNVHDDYHRATDDIERINAGGEARVIELAERIARRIADADARPTFVRAAAPPRAVASASSGARPYLGSVPDMAAGDVPGLRVSGVTASSPGDRAGLRAGDLIVEFDGKPVTDLDTYSEALYARKAGDTVPIVVLRAGARVTLSATLGTRSQ